MSDPMERLEQVLAGLPGRIAAAQQQVAELIARPFEAHAADGSVSATVDGSGQLVGVVLSTGLAPQLDNLTLSERIAEAINNALDAVAAARDGLVGGGGAGDGDGEQPAGAEQLFDYRMSELERTIDQLESRLRDLPG